MSVSVCCPLLYRSCHKRMVCPLPRLFIFPPPPPLGLCLGYCVASSFLKLRKMKIKTLQSSKPILFSVTSLWQGYFVVYALDAILISEHMMRQTKEFWPRKLKIIEASSVVSV